jgi:hypothetical protein
MRLLLLSLCCMFLLPACRESKPSPQEQAPQIVEKTAVYPQPAPGILETLSTRITNVDYIFHNLPISMSLTEAGTIQTVMAHLSGLGAVPVNHGCKPIGRIFYVASGETVLTGDLYFSGDCRFVIFLEEEQPLFAVRLHEAGVAFLQGAGVPL